MVLENTEVYLELLEEVMYHLLELFIQIDLIIIEQTLVRERVYIVERLIN